MNNKRKAAIITFIIVIGVAIGVMHPKIGVMLLITALGIACAIVIYAVILLILDTLKD